jgi:hypothetical protein
MPILFLTPHTFAVKADDGRLLTAIDRLTLSPVISPSLTNAQEIGFLSALGL